LLYDMAAGVDFESVGRGWLSPRRLSPRRISGRKAAGKCVTMRNMYGVPSTAWRTCTQALLVPQLVCGGGDALQCEGTYGLCFIRRGRKQKIPPHNRTGWTGATAAATHHAKRQKPGRRRRNRALTAADAALVARARNVGAYHLRFWWAQVSRSCFIMSSTSSSSVTLGSQPSSRRAFVASPWSRSTSVGRK